MGSPEGWPRISTLAEYLVGRKQGFVAGRLKLTQGYLSRLKENPNVRVLEHLDGSLEVREDKLIARTEPMAGN